VEGIEGVAPCECRSADFNGLLLERAVRAELATDGGALSVVELCRGGGIARGMVDITGELIRGEDGELLVNACTGTDWRRMDESAGMEDIRLARMLPGFPLEYVSLSLTFWGVTVVALLKLLRSDALEMALGFEMLAVPAAEERREIREGVSDCVEGRFADIVDRNRAAVMKALLSANGKEKNAWCDPRVPRLTQPRAQYRSWRGERVY
jgi:hypothetical protein